MFLDRVNHPNKRNRELLLSEEREEINPSVDVVTDTLSPSEKRSLLKRRFIPLGISLLLLGAAVTIRFVIPLPSPQEINKGSNGTIFGNNTGNFTSSFDVDLF